MWNEWKKNKTFYRHMSLVTQWAEKRKNEWKERGLCLRYDFFLPSFDLFVPLFPWELFDFFLLCPDNKMQYLEKLLVFVDRIEKLTSPFTNTRVHVCGFRGWSMHTIFQIRFVQSWQLTVELTNSLVKFTVFYNMWY